MARRTLSLIGGFLLTTACSAVLTPGITRYPATSDVNLANLSSMRRGESCAKTILFPIGPNGRASPPPAQGGGLRSVGYVDNRNDNKVFRRRYCVIADGE